MSELRFGDAFLDSAEHFKIIFEHAPDGLYISDLAGTFVDGNRAAERLTGYRREELIGQSFLKLKLLSSKDILQAAKLLALNALRKATGPDVFTLVRKDGTTVPVEITTYPVEIKGKTLVLGVARDISERLRSERALRASEAKYKLLFSHAPTAIYDVDFRTGRFLAVNDVMCAKLGYTEDELLSTKFSDILSPASLKAWAERWARLQAGEPVPENPEYEVKTKDGRLLWASVNVHYHRDPEGRIIGGTMVAHDISDRKKAEAEVQESRELYRLLLQNANDAVFLHEINRAGPGRFLEVNEQASQMLGYTNEEFLAMSVSGIDVPEQRDKIPRITEALFKTGRALFQTEHRAKDGRRVPVEVSIRLFEFKGRPVVLSIVRDIRERKSAERDLAESFDRLRKSMRGVIQVIAQTVEMRDPYTAGHQRRVADLARAIATEMGQSRDFVDGIRTTGLIHDVGKVAIPAEILSKPTKLSALEYDLVKTHAQVGYGILKDVEFPWPVAETIYQHHERLDGSGYPRGLKGDEIILEARILIVADVVEAMSTHRPFRPARGEAAALDEITRNRGRLYDPATVDACVRLFRDKGFQFKD
jgi:PAS domain S-box-containing protein/putative nucleotidyltransferase with HDIG domain